MKAAGEGTRRDRLEMLLPYYLNGTLADGERRTVEEWLATDPAGAIALEEAEAEYSATAVVNEEIRPPADALSRLTAALERETVNGRLMRGSPIRRATELFRSLPSGLAWGAAVVAVVLLIAQTIGSDPEPERTASVTRTTQPPVEPSVLVSFTEDATISEISDIMKKHGLAIVSGPMPDGLYRVKIPAETAAQYEEISAEFQREKAVAWTIAGKRPAE